MKKWQNYFKKLSIIALLGVIYSCSGGEGTLIVRLTDAPIDDKLGKKVEQVNVTITQVSVKQQGGNDADFVSVTDEANKVNLIEYLNGITTTLGERDLESGDYTEIRVVVATDNTIKFENDDTLYDLKIPSGTSSGIKIKTSFTIESGQDNELIIDFDAAESITAKGDETYNLNPVIKVK